MTAHVPSPVARDWAESVLGHASAGAEPSPPSARGGVALHVAPPAPTSAPAPISPVVAELDAEGARVRAAIERPDLAPTMRVGARVELLRDIDVRIGSYPWESVIPRGCQGTVLAVMPASPLARTQDRATDWGAAEVEFEGVGVWVGPGEARVVARAPR